MALVKAATFPAVVTAKKVATDRLSYYRAMMPIATPASGQANRKKLVERAAASRKAK